MRKPDPQEEALEMLRDRAREAMGGEHSEPDGDEGARVTIIIGGPGEPDMDDDEDDASSF